MRLTRRIAETHQDLIRSAVWKHIKKNGGDFEDLFSAAQLLFVKAVRSYEKTEGRTLSSWIFFKISRGLLDIHKTEKRRSAFRENSSVEPSYHHPPMIDLIDGMTEDALFVIKLALDSPKEVVKVAIRRGGNGRNMRQSMRDYLQGFGWSKARIRNAFDEIKEGIETR